MSAERIKAFSDGVWRSSSPSWFSSCGRRMARRYRRRRWATGAEACSYVAQGGGGRVDDGKHVIDETGHR